MLLASHGLEFAEFVKLTEFHMRLSSHSLGIIRKPNGWGSPSLCRPMVWNCNTISRIFGIPNAFVASWFGLNRIARIVGISNVFVAMAPAGIGPFLVSGWCRVCTHLDGYLLHRKVGAPGGG